jgi:hypothetical protein
MDGLLWAVLEASARKGLILIFCVFLTGSAAMRLGSKAQHLAINIKFAAAAMPVSVWWIDLRQCASAPAIGVVSKQCVRLRSCQSSSLRRIVRQPPDRFLGFVRRAVQLFGNLFFRQSLAMQGPDPAIPRIPVCRVVQSLRLPELKLTSENNMPPPGGRFQSEQWPVCQGTKRQ